jgi:hypothetical protein
MKLTDTQRNWLQWLHDNGGSGFLDTYGRVIANGANSKQGSQISWLNLFVKGAVCAENDRIVLTEAGRHVLKVEMKA